jgi:hypothetical protein
MKFLSREKQLHLARLARGRERKRIRRGSGLTAQVVRRAMELTRVKGLQQAFSEAHELPAPRDGDRIPFLVPEVVSLRENGEQTIKLVDDLRRTVLLENQRAFLYFDRVRKLEPAAALLLVAEIFRCVYLRPGRNGRSVSGNYPADRSVFLQLREMGFYKLLSLDEVTSIDDEGLDPERPVFLPFRSMSTVDPEFAANFGDLITGGAIRMEELARRRMVAALKEAMGNAHEHAYLRPGEYPAMRKRWYLAGYLDPPRKELMVLILDQGIGIPNTLDVTLFENLDAHLTGRWGRRSDATLIAAATELHRTSTGAGGRGRGFFDMKSFVDVCDDGELRVRSNRGSYAYVKDQEDILEDHDASIGGTLIEWRVRHSSTVEVAHD